MTEEHNGPSRFDAKLLDKLVDGELDADARRELLSALDETSGGWRRCALAFLEAQAWRSELRVVVGKSGSPESQNAKVACIRRSPFWQIRRAAVLAAALTMAFVTGWLLGPRGHGRRDDNVPVVAAGIRPSDESDGVPPDDERPGPEVLGTLAPAPVRLAGVLALQVDDQGKPREIRIPVLEGPGVDTRWLLQQPPAIRASVVQALERRGHKVEAHRQLLTVDLKDGRKLVLPVDEVDVRFAHRVYQ
jgi:hypothetical protein